MVHCVMITPGQQTLACISEEHHQVRGVLIALAELVDSAQRDSGCIDASRLEDLLIEAVTIAELCGRNLQGRLLHPLLLQRCPALGPVLHRLHAEHDRASELFVEVRVALEDCIAEGPIRLAALIASARRYVNQRRGHLEVLEEYIVPVAAHYLTPTDWSVLDAAFADAYATVPVR